MNKTFKVVFNKARGALMVVNEATSSVQKKGTKTVIAAAVTAMIAGVAGTAMAAEATVQDFLAGYSNKTDMAEWGLMINSSLLSSTEQSSFTISDKQYEGNTRTIASYRSGMGGVAYIAQTKNAGSVINWDIKWERAQFSSNKLTTTSDFSNSAQLIGGALMMKGTTTTVANTFVDTDFDNNSVVGVNENTQVAGGALYLDAALNTDGNTAVTAEIATTRGVSLAYTGNKVKSNDNNRWYDLYGAIGQSRGGFAFLDRSAVLRFNTAENSSITIGIENADDPNVDSIASSLHGDSWEGAELLSPLIEKIGAGSVVINSSLNDYYGKIDVKGGTLTLTRNVIVREQWDVTSGSLALADVELGQVQSGNYGTLLRPDNGTTASVNVVGSTGSLYVHNGGILTAKSITVSGATIDERYLGPNKSITYNDQPYQINVEESGQLTVEAALTVKQNEKLDINGLQNTTGEVKTGSLKVEKDAEIALRKGKLTIGSTTKTTSENTGRIDNGGDVMIDGTDFTNNGIFAGGRLTIKNGTFDNKGLIGEVNSGNFISQVGIIVGQNGTLKSGITFDTNDLSKTNLLLFNQMTLEEGGALELHDYATEDDGIVFEGGVELNLLGGVIRHKKDDAAASDYTGLVTVRGALPETPTTVNVSKAYELSGLTLGYGTKVVNANGKDKIVADDTKADSQVNILANGALTVGELTLKGKGIVNVGEKGQLTATKIAISHETGEAAAINVKKDGTLTAPAAQLFTEGSSFVNTDVSKIVGTKDKGGFIKGLNAETGGTIILGDSSASYYTDASITALRDAHLGVTFNVGKVTNYVKPGDSSALIDNVLKPTEDVKASSPVTTTPDSDTVTTTIDVTNTAAQTITVEDSAAKPEDKKVITDVVLAPTTGSAASKTITIVGTTDSKPLISNTTGASVNKVTVENGLTLQLGTASQTTATEETKPETKGELKDLVVKGGLDVVNMVASFTNLVADGGKINIGSGDDRAAVKTDKLEMKAGSMIFLDPAWKDDAALDVIGNASHLEVANGADSTVAGNIVVGQNAIVTYGATVEQADAAFSGANMVWGKDAVTAALYLGHQIDVTTGSVAVDGSRSGSAGTAATTGNVELFANSLLMVDEGAVGEAAIKGKLVAHAPSAAADRKAQVAVINSTDGKFTLATAGVEGIALEQITTDNQFVDASYKDGVITTDVDEQKLAGAVASLGIQQVARRADTTVANTIADRTAQTIAGEGVSLWADVGGERYEADDLDNKAQYEANMFYGAFGADVGINPNVRVGAALQYGTGDSKSDNYNIKNDIDAVSLALYGSYNVTDTAKIVGEFAYTQTSNEITSSERLLKNDIDADMISLGVRGQHEFKVGAVKFVPSIGLRVSRISTDAFNVGAVKVDVDDQTLVQIPLSLAVSADALDANGWKLSPYAKVSFTPSFGDDEINVRGYDQSSLDTMPVQGDFGLSATNGKVTFGASLSAGFGQDGAQNFGGKVSVRYAF